MCIRDSFGARRAIGMAVRAAGVAHNGDEAMLREAADVLGEAGAHLERARTLVDLGAALRRGGRRADARAALAAAGAASADGDVVVDLLELR